MNLMRRLMRARHDDSERGMAMILVIGVSAALAILVVATIAYSVGSLHRARSDQDWNAAMAAAYAGVEEFQSRLANDTGYFAYGNPASTFSNPTHSASPSVTLPAGAATNAAFGVGPSGTWATVAGSSGAAQFRYELDNSSHSIDGTLRLRSTGRAGGETRTIVADLKQEGFISFLYFTDYEVSDPTANDPTNTTNCAIRYPNPGWCGPINFTGRDVIRGPLHTNDAIHTNGAAQFTKKTTTSWQNPSGPNYISTGAAPVFGETNDPSFAAIIGMPATNSQLKKETRSDLPTDVPSPGCLYTGPTSITFNSGGTMTVISPWTIDTNTTGDTDAGGSSPAKCGTPGPAGLAKTTGTGSSTKYVGQTIAVPPNLVIYVQTVPSTNGNVNKSTSTTTPPLSPTVACATNGNSIGFPMANETVPFTDAYGCRNGDVFVKGQLKGQVTIAAENYVYVTGDLTYTDASTDLLGLVGNNAVWVWNPMRKTGTGSSASAYTELTSDNRTIDAAILSVAHTFMVQNYDKGASTRGTLTVWGAIAQKYRGPVGTTNLSGAIATGYVKDYTYFDRFAYTAPPKFLSPVTTTYGVNVWVEVSPVFDKTGSYR